MLKLTTPKNEQLNSGVLPAIITRTKPLTLHEFETIFHQLFFASENTQLVNGMLVGANEPLYTPASNCSPAKIIYANGFLQSALHETAHWCHAGLNRRQKIDYGYWYVGDSRNQQQQVNFEKVELIPQAYELLLSQACGIEFQVSLDNFNSDVFLDRDGFFQKVILAAEQALLNGLPQRLNRLYHEIL